jgi:hypothetical protein
LDSGRSPVHVPQGVYQIRRRFSSATARPPRRAGTAS